MLAMGGSTDVTGWVRWQFVWGRRSAPLLLGPSDLQPVFLISLFGSFVFGTPWPVIWRNGHLQQGSTPHF